MVTKAVLFAPSDRHECPERSPHALRPPTPPLALLPVGNRPLIAHALEELAGAGIDDVIVISERAVATQVQDAVDCANPSAAHVSVAENSSFLDALRMLAPHLGDEPFLVHLGDSLRHDGLTSATAAPQTGKHDVLALVQTPGAETTPVGAGLASLRTAGIYVFGPGVLELQDEGEVPSRWDVQIAEASERMAAAGGNIEIRMVHDWWRYQQRPQILLQANRFFLSGLKMAPTEAWLENTDLQGPVAIDRSARLRATTVRGPAIIGPDVEISDAYIGPYSAVGRGVVIENAEVEHSIILPGASIRHLGGRLEASVVGPDAQIFRDFRLPRAFRLNVGEGAEVALT
jgi:glucose-1-phosphate thymidylyltransferase